jgi:hypothetical protein
MQKRGIMSEEFGPDDAAERERQAYNTEDMPVPPCPGTALPTLADQPVRRCTKGLGHQGACADDAGELLGEDAEPLPRREPGAAYDHDALLRELFDGVPGARTTPRLKLTALNPQPVRVRFVDLPHRHREAKGPFGNPVHVAEPGGFALVVDRFRDAGHRGSEATRWELFGQAIGAHVVLCYVGELDVIGWLDNV